MGILSFWSCLLCLTDVPTTFMDLMNKVFKPYLDILFFIIFIDDILIYSRNKEYQASPLKIVVHTLNDRELYVNFFECEFWLESMEFLVHILSGDNIIVDTQKIEVVLKWRKPTSLTDTRTFLGLDGYYKRFVESFSSILSPLIKLTKKTIMV